MKLDRWWDALGLRAHLKLEVYRTMETVGVNSTLTDGKHMLMWDFDGAPLGAVKGALAIKQDMYLLPAIYIMATGKRHHYHAYCFYRCKWIEALAIVSSTPFVDKWYVQLAEARGYFTLRIRDSDVGRILHADTLPSLQDDTVDVEEMESCVKYVTRLKR